MRLGIKRFIYLLPLKHNSREMAELLSVVLQKCQWDSSVSN